MKKNIFYLLLSITLITSPVLASEQTVLSDATALYYSYMKGQDSSNVPQVEKELLGLMAVSMQYAATFKGDELIDAGNLILKKYPYSKNPNKECMKPTAYMALTMGHAFCFEFTEAHKALDQLAMYKGKVYGGQDCTELYNQCKKTLIAIESAYTSAKASGYDVSSARTKLMIKRQLGL